MVIYRSKVRYKKHKLNNQHLRIVKSETWTQYICNLKVWSEPKIVLNCQFIIYDRLPLSQPILQAAIYKADLEMYVSFSAREKLVENLFSTIRHSLNALFFCADILRCFGSTGRLGPRCRVQEQPDREGQLQLRRAHIQCVLKVNAYKFKRDACIKHVLNQSFSFCGNSLSDFYQDLQFEQSTSFP